MGVVAILLWGGSSACIVLLGRRLGIWQFLALTPAIGGLLQIVGYLVMGRSLRSLLLPPPKLWLAVALGFVVYLLLYTTALVGSVSEEQTVGVSLMNYLWPTLAILFTTWLVPGMRLHGRLLVALGLSLAGVLLANGRSLAWPDGSTQLWPYVLGGLGAASWAAYCALVSRWRDWAHAFAATPLGFLLVSAAAAGICLYRGEWEPMGLRDWVGVVLTALGPWASGYMLWELALHRAPGTTLGLLAAATPVLSTLCLLGLFALAGSNQAGEANGTILLAASVLIGLAVVVGNGKTPDATSSPGCDQR